jgi:hypothetical protein
MGKPQDEEQSGVIQHHFPVPADAVDVCKIKTKQRRIDADSIQKSTAKVQWQFIPADDT